MECKNNDVRRTLEDLARLHPSHVCFSWGQAPKYPLFKRSRPSVKILDPGRKREYSKYGSDLPLLIRKQSIN